MSTAVYIGAGLDVRPIRALHETIKHFIYVDSRPYTQQPHYTHYQCDDFFVAHMVRKMEALDFIVESRNDTPEDNMSCFCCKKAHRKPFVIKFTRGDVMVTYYMNTVFPQDSEPMQDIAKADTLIIAGYDPDKRIMDTMVKPIHVICWENTHFGFDESNASSGISNDLHGDAATLANVSKITYYKKTYTAQSYENLRKLCENEKTRMV